MNRRAFFGTLLGGFVAAVAPKPPLRLWGLPVRWRSRSWVSRPDMNIVLSGVWEDGISDWVNLRVPLADFLEKHDEV